MPVAHCALFLHNTATVRNGMRKTPMVALFHKRNPVFWQEITHQRRAAPRRTWIGKVVPPLVLLAILIGVPLSLSDPIIAFRHSREFALVSIWLIHAIVAVRCIIAGANTVSREHVSQTWDSLVLTGISARQILLGKWLAALQRAAPWIVALGTVRLAMLPVFMVALLNRFAYFTYRRYGSYSLYDGYEPPSVEWLPWATYAAVVLTVLITLVEAACCTMLGIFASTAFKRGTLGSCCGICGALHACGDLRRLHALRARRRFLPLVSLRAVRLRRWRHVAALYASSAAH
jgi:hypothetical protein